MAEIARCLQTFLECFPLVLSTASYGSCCERIGFESGKQTSFLAALTGQNLMRDDRRSTTHVIAFFLGTGKQRVARPVA